ncbi:MAG: hypothetical protein IPG86_03225 [Chitinophagaceae bacterium]|nr:hypothetical protein [Chitinophagaceae bacterium]
MNRINRLLLLLTPVVFFSACNHHPGSGFTEKKYILKREETIRIPELDLQISNKGCGRQWTGDSETPFCELELKATDTSFRFGQSFSPVYFRNLEIKVMQMNPWNREEDSIPPGGCRIWIHKLPDTAR